MSYGQIVSFIWAIADLIRDSFRRGEYQNVILPLTVLRRLDCVLAPTKKRVLETNAKLHGKLENLDDCDFLALALQQRQRRWSRMANDVRLLLTYCPKVL